IDCNFLQNDLSFSYPDVPIPNHDVYHHLFESGHYEGNVDATIFIDGTDHRRMTVAELHRNSKRLANALRTRHKQNRLDYPIMVFGALAAGLTVTTASSYYTVDELVHQLRDSKASILFVDHSLVIPGRKAAALVGIAPENVIVSGIHDGHSPDLLFQGNPSVRRLIQEHEEMDAVRVPDNELNDTVAFICYSSALPPKGVMLTHRNMVACACQYMYVEQERAAHNLMHDVYVSFLPFFHIYALNCILVGAVIRRDTAVIMSGFDLKKFLELNQRYKATYAYLVPPICLMLAKDPIVDQYDLSTWQEVCCGGAPLGAELTKALTTRLNVQLREGFGMTETGAGTHLTLRTNPVQGSVGVLVPNLTAKIIDEAGNILPVGAQGELCLRGPSIMKGYLNRNEATAATFDKDGYLLTGDIAYADESGHFFIVDRAKEFIKYNAFQVAPTELEEILQTHQAVADACVVGYYCSERATELPMAYVSLKPDYVNKVTAEELLRGGVEFVPDIWQLLRRIMREQAKNVTNHYRRNLNITIHR
ncbi:hypothetical protein BDF22DRAFT_703030, partial [Syncephalis plumigaleata]